MLDEAVFSVYTMNMKRLCVIALLLVWATSSFAATDETRHWKPLAWNPEKYVNISGTISGLENLKTNDEVAVFDVYGNCYGTGRVYNETNYALRAFQFDEAGETPDGDPIPDDPEVPGFNIGDEVFFYVYVETKEYLLTPVIGQNWRYSPSDTRIPPIIINLAYEAGTDPPPGTGPNPGPEPKLGPDPGSNPNKTVLPGGMPYLGPSDTIPEIVIPSVIKEKIFVEEKAGAALPPEVPAMLPDYYQKPPAGSAPPSRKIDPLSPGKKKIIVRTPHEEPEGPFVPRKRFKIPKTGLRNFRSWPLWLRLLSLLLLLILIAFAVRKLLQMQEEERKE